MGKDLPALVRKGATIGGGGIAGGVILAQMVVPYIIADLMLSIVVGVLAFTIGRMSKK